MFKSTEVNTVQRKIYFTMQKNLFPIQLSWAEVGYTQAQPIT